MTLLFDGLCGVLQNGSGSALTPECTSAAADLKMIATIAANAPDTFSTGDNAILKKICDQGASHCYSILRAA